MAPRIALALAIHNHQPVGNFGWVFAEVFDQAYAPLVDALGRYPRVRLALHYTGPLLEWLAAERPGFVEDLRSLVARGQVELMGGGLYEPVLASLPERDRVAQLKRMADAIEAFGGRRPRGAWMAERVWEPTLPTSLDEAGYDWTILDDAHFRAASIPEENLWGAYTTEDQGRSLRVFGTEFGLRYLIPFQEVDAAIAHLRAHATEAGDRVGMMGDDGEKFGAWPTTWEHCWGKGRWMERFFEALEANTDWLTTTTPSDWLAGHPPIGQVYVPTSSYAEMGEWSLPPEEAVVYSALSHRAVEERRPERRWLRGGFWRNFQVRYREINDLHKQMLRTSAKVAAMPDGPARARAEDHLHRGQSNDCYWHGLFGGIYIGHMRLATYEHLIAAEDLADAASGTFDAAEAIDTDLDGLPDVRLASSGQVVTVDLDEGAGIGGWDIRAARHALTAVMRRRPEAYHAKLVAAEQAAAAPRVAVAGAAGATGAVESIHEIVRMKEPGLAAKLHYDLYERRSGLVRFLPTDATHGAWADAAAEELGDARDGAWTVAALEPGAVVLERAGSVDGIAVGLRKSIRLGGERHAPTLELELDVENRGDRRLATRLGVEWAITMLGGGGNPSAWWDVGSERTAHDIAGSATDVERLGQGNSYIGIDLATEVSPAAEAWWSPIDTISNSEAGFERVYQGSALLLSWPIDLAPGERVTVNVAHAVTTSGDRAQEEVAGG